MTTAYSELMNLTEIIKQVRLLEISTRKNVNSIFAGNYRSSFHGRGIEYEDVREYSVGDDVRDINWKLTAREGKPFIKKYREERELKTTLIMNLSSDLHFGTGDHLKYEVALQIAAMLGFSIVNSSDQIGLITFGTSEKKYIPPKKGKGNILRILQTLLLGYEESAPKQKFFWGTLFRRQESGNNQSHSLSQALQFFLRISRQRQVCFLITDEISPEDEKMIRMVNRKHDLIIFRITDPFEKNPHLESGGNFSNIGTESTSDIPFENNDFIERYQKIYHEQEKQFSDCVRRNALDVIEISTNRNIAKELMKYFKKRQMRA